ncbi:MAG: DUF3800 domain-containing protein [Kiritimatiellia bacterium]
MKERTLSIFVDESGRLQYPDAGSRFYIVSMILHDQRIDITPVCDELSRRFRVLHLEKLCFHAGPLIRQEKVFAVLDRSFRYRIFAVMMAFARQLDFQYHCLIVDKKLVNSSEQIVMRLAALLNGFLAAQCDALVSFDRVKIYYDCGQTPITNLLHRTFSGVPGVRVEFAQAVKPERYRLFQLADLICTVKLIETRLACGEGMTPSEFRFFGGPKGFRHNVLRYLQRKEMP